MTISWGKGRGGVKIYIYIYIYIFTHSYIRASISHIHIQRKMPDVAKEQMKKKDGGAWGLDVTIFAHYFLPLQHSVIASSGLKLAHNLLEGLTVGISLHFHLN